MANDPFDFSDVFADIENKINDFMASGDTQEVLKRYVAKNAEESVYAAYTPMGKHPYVRRYSLKNIDTYDVTSGRLSMEITSRASGAGAAGEGLTDIIEGGTGYDWVDSAIYANQPFPRPWMEKGVDKFTDDYLLPTIHSVFFDD